MKNSTMILGYPVDLERGNPIHAAVAKSARIKDLLKVPSNLTLNSLAWIQLKDILAHPDWDMEVFDVLTSKGRMREPTEEERQSYIHRAHGGQMVRQTYIRHGVIVDDQFVLTLYFHLKQPVGEQKVWIPESHTDMLPIKKHARAEQEVSLDNVL